MKSKILFVLSHTAYLERYILSDLDAISDLKIFYLKKTLLGKFLVGNKSPLCKLLKKSKLYDYFINQKNIYNIGKYIKNKKTQYLIIIQAQCLNRISYAYFNNLKNRFNCELIIYSLDSVHANSPTFLSVKDTILNNNWDRIYTYDYFDSMEFGWSYIGRNYFSTSKLPPRNKQKPIKNDIYFAGGIKGGKEKILFQIYEKLLQNNLNPNFYLYCYSDKQKNELQEKYPSYNIFFREWQQYKKLLNCIQETNCIIEILQENQKTQSVRYFEALYFNKKLLTNNPEIINLPYYNPEYMKYFKNVEDIDFEWLKKDIKVDYHYQNDFTPVNFIKQVINDFKITNISI